MEKLMVDTPKTQITRLGTVVILSMQKVINAPHPIIQPVSRFFLKHREKIPITTLSFSTTFQPAN